MTTGTPGWKFRWFRTTFHVPQEHGQLALFFSKLHKKALVFVNGELVNGPEDRPKGQWGVSFLADMKAAAHPGENTLAIRRPHAWGRLVEKPVLVIDRGR